MTDPANVEQGDELILREFVTETNENLERADQCLLDLERTPNDLEPIRFLFRTVHTLKSSCGWLGFRQLEQLAHDAESLLAKSRSVEGPVSPEIIEGLLATIDLTRKQLAAITGDAKDPTLDGEIDRWGARLRALADGITLPTDAPAATRSSEAPDQAALAVVPDSEQQLPKAPQPALEPTGALIPAAPDLSIRVDVQLLDELVKLVGELVITRNQVAQLVGSTYPSTLIAASQRLNVVTSELQDRIMLTRMQPLSHIWSRFPRLIRDAANSCGKKVRLQMEGADTELDRTMVEAMRDPLTHLLRNAVDHGIESPEQRSASGKSAEGVVQLRAYHEEGQVHIEVEDDGRGIDAAAVRRRAVTSGMFSPAEAEALSTDDVLGLIFAAGLSTREEVTELSGRGVGMDVVKTDVERVGGRVEVHSTAGMGTRITLTLPLTLAILPSVLVECAGDTYSVPQSNLLELVHLRGESGKAQIRKVGEGALVYSLRGKLLPILYLSEILELGTEFAQESDDVFILVLLSGGRRFGLIVDSALDTQEIVVKPLGRHFANTAAFSGATILGDGRLALILDAAGIAQRGGIRTDRTRQSSPDDAPTSDADGASGEGGISRMLLMTTRTGARLTVPLDKVLRLEEIAERDVERIGGREVVQYRGGLLRLLRVEDLLEEPPLAPETGNGVGAANTGSLQVLVHRHGGFEIGLVVDQILDIIEERVEFQEIRPRRGILGSVVLDGRATEVLDLDTAVPSATAEAQAEAL